MNNLQVVKVYADRHLTGANDKRPEFQRMLREAERGHWQYVITWKVDRFARMDFSCSSLRHISQSS
ncbi:recombinase family protein [Acutalibacter sp. 1XD8-33]|uniref:recombinase family protein n=1 Tax=Acutalibacter sp. 1XD8-33 TaxID=2320081 RepID=UPI001FAAD2CE|nr:recombinase family protein [Acutalibacter sp. 1XD8-33]